MFRAVTSAIAVTALTAAAAAALAGCGSTADANAAANVSVAPAAPVGAVPGVTVTIGNDTGAELAIGTTDYCVDDMVVQTRPLAAGTALAATSDWSAVAKTMVCVEVRYPDGTSAQAALINPVVGEPFANFRAPASTRPLATLGGAGIVLTDVAADTPTKFDFGGGGHVWTVERGPREPTGTQWRIRVTG